MNGSSNILEHKIRNKNGYTEEELHVVPVSEPDPPARHDFHPDLSQRLVAPALHPDVLPEQLHGDVPWGEECCAAEAAVLIAFGWAVGSGIQNIIINLRKLTSI